jgi:uncharacterized protein YjbJ (UPF0337 family)
MTMDENRLSGSAKNLDGKVNLGGKIEEAFGRATGDVKTQVHGQAQHGDGSVQELYGQAKDAAGEAINAVGKMPASLEDTIRHYIQNRPYTTAAIALALGWLIGRSHRPF